MMKNMSNVMYDVRIIDEKDLPAEMIKVASDIGYQSGKLEVLDKLSKAEKSATKKGIFGIIVGGVAGYIVGKKVMKKKNKEKKSKILD